VPFETPKSAFHFQRPAQPGALGLDREGCPDPPTASTEAPRGRDATNSAAISSSNGGTEAINLIIEIVRRLAHGFRDFNHYRLRILLAASGDRAYRG